jgi:beta-glucosidase
MNAAGAVTASVAEQTLKEALQKAGCRQIAVQVDAISGAKEYELSLPTAVLQSLTTGQSLLIKTELASVAVTTGMLEGLETAPTGNIALAIGKVDPSSLPAEAAQAAAGKPVIELSFRVNGQSVKWSGSPVPASITIPYPAPPSELAESHRIVVWYIADNGQTTPVPSSRYDSGAVTFETNHFSHYAVVYSPVSFSDTRDYPWAEKQIEALAARGIIEGTSQDSYTPAANIKRADYLHLLVKTLGLTAEFSGNFEDVSTTDYYYTTLGIAKKMGIAEGSEGNRFNPEAQISRQDMFTLTYRALFLTGAMEEKGTAADLHGFADAASVADYAADSIATLYKSKLLEGDGSRILPLSPATRAETAVLMHRIYQAHTD